MRVAISLLVSTVVFTAVAVPSDLVSQFGFEAQGTKLAKSRTNNRPKRPQDPTPHRGSGRRDFMRYNSNLLYDV